ncbi:unnamed protein product [[Actinomadura] parvosata subsp. kistnae]|uniref:Uncharacterized protein n=1 Tax=[Actinomadura] parvosata subsp. kistnae TaxID=1909395 RepID=A0A1U9ZZD2_9ACTN|nr:hypothetical protein [Nonomuraea sp. ATCC 55076]AQZ63279.1 hypothetical protein BKM31_19045 [Nonomuraea sp. ATCC 55076]SPL98969.1 unnamed protein product [Actinomadura parvosata subsp. kistnae]
MIPEREQIGSVELTTWRVVPGESNPDKNEDGVWGIAGGDSDEYALYLEVLDAECPKKVAEFIVEAVTSHVRRLRLEGALADVHHLREQQQAVDDVLDPSNPHLVEEPKLARLIEQVGQVGGEFVRDRFSTGPDDLQTRLYPQLTAVAATAVAWMEGIHGAYGHGTQPSE